MIQYTYKITHSDANTNTMIIEYSANGYPTVSVGSKVPYVGESLDDVVLNNAPFNIWQTANANVAIPDIGATGSYIPPSVAPVAAPTLATLKLQKESEISYWRYSRENLGITYNGKKIASDRASRAELSNKILAIQNNTITTTLWKTMDGSFVEYTLTDLQNILSLMTQYVEECFIMEKNFTANVELCNTANSVLSFAVPWSDVNMVFSTAIANVANAKTTLTTINIMA